METCAMVSEVVMKNHDKAVLLRNASVSVKEVVPTDSHMMLNFKISLNETCCCWVFTLLRLEKYCCSKWRLTVLIFRLRFPRDWLNHVSLCVTAFGSMFQFVTTECFSKQIFLLGRHVLRTWATVIIFKWFWRKRCHKISVGFSVRTDPISLCSDDWQIAVKDSIRFPL